MTININKKDVKKQQKGEKKMKLSTFTNASENTFCE